MLGAENAEKMDFFSDDMSLGSYEENRKRKKRNKAWRMSRQKPNAFPMTVCAPESCMKSKNSALAKGSAFRSAY